MGDVEKLMSAALAQLEEHKAWLKDQMHEWMNAEPGGEWKLNFRLVINMVDDIKLRMSRADEGEVTVLWEYPDDLLAFFRLETTPAHLRATLEGGRVVDLDQPGLSAKRAPS